MKKNNKKKGCIIFSASFFILVIIVSLLPDIAKDSLSIIEASKTNIEEQKYKTAIADLKTIGKEDSLYIEAQHLIKRADSLQNLTEEEKQTAITLEIQNREKEALVALKEKLKREIASIDEGIDFSGYRETVEVLQIELVLFASWAKFIQEGQNSKNSEIQNLAKELKTKISKIQIKEFPLLRKEYCRIANAKMWENDIEVSSSGRRKDYINFTGAVFAANKNKQLFQKEVQEILTMFRFKQSRYRWYNGESEYTYYTIYEGKDSDLVFFLGIHRLC